MPKETFAEWQANFERRLSASAIGDGRYRLADGAEGDRDRGEKRRCSGGTTIGGPCATVNRDVAGSSPVSGANQP